MLRFCQKLLSLFVLGLHIFEIDAIVLGSECQTAPLAHLYRSTYRDTLCIERATGPSSGRCVACLWDLAMEVGMSLVEEEEGVDMIAHVWPFLCEFGHQRFMLFKRMSPVVSKDSSVRRVCWPITPTGQ
jgi:hypothetical protein